MRFLSLLFGVALLAPTAHAQTCTTSWTNAAGGPWTTAGNWDNGVPDAADDVCITLAGTYTVTVGAFSVNSLTVGGASGVQTLQLSVNFSLATTGSVGANGALLWRGGYLQSGTLTNAGAVHIADVTNNSRGVSGAAAVFRNTGTVEHSDAGLFYVFGDGRAENAGTWTFSGDGDVSGSSGAGTFVNEAGATLRKTGGALTTLAGGGLTIENGGTIDVTGGELRFDRPSTHTAATLTTGAGGTLRFNSDTPTFTGAITGAQAGALVLSTGFTVGAGASWAFTGNGLTWTGGYLTAGTLTNTGLVRVADVTTNSRGVSGAAAVFRNTGTVEHSDAGQFYVFGDGRAENAATWTFSGDGDLSGFSGAGTFANEAGATFRKSGAGTTTLVAGGGLVFENAGALDVAGGELRFDRPSAHTAATFTTAAGTTLRFVGSPPTFTGAITGAQAGALVLSTGFTVGAGASWAFTGNGLTWTAGYLTDGTLTNAGAVHVADVTSTSRGVNGATAVFRNTGTVAHSDAGPFYVFGDGRAENAATWTFSGDGDLSGFSGAGTFANEAGATFRKSGAGTTTLVAGGGLVFENGGTIDVTGGELRFDRPSTHTTATLTTAAGSTIRFIGSNPTFTGTTGGAQAGALVLSTGVTAGAGAAWAFGGNGLTWTAGYLTAGTLTNTGAVHVAALTDNSRGVNGATAVFRNTGTVTHSDAGLFYVWNGGRAENAGTWTFSGDGDVFGSSGAGTFVNEAGGILRKAGGAATVFSGGGLVVQNAGIVSVETGEFDVDRPFAHDAGALVRGTGTFDVTNATFTFGGDVGPGLSPGQLTWEGPYAPTATSALRIEFGGTTAGTTYDRLAVTGTATLGGTLALTVAAGQAPTVGESYTILTATSVTGAFATVTPPPGYEVSLTYNPTNVVVTVTAVGVVTTFTGTEGWRLVAPAVTASTYDDVVGPFWTQGFPGSDYNGISAVANVYRYDEAVVGGLTDGYVEPGNQADPFPTGTGAFFYVYADDDVNTPPIDGGFPKTLVQSGVDVTGPFTFGVTYTPSGTPANDGWTLVGNPYAATLDWTAAGWTRTNVSSAVYVWDPATAQYLTHNGVTGSLPGGLVAPAQGFWVQATGASPALQAPAGARTTGGTFVGRPAAAPSLELRLTAATGTPGAASAIAVFADGATDGLDALDAYELTPLAGDALALWTRRVSGGEALDLQALAPESAEGTELEVGVAAWAAGAPAQTALVLTWPTLPEGVPARLLDRVTGAEVDMRAVTAYPFTHTTDPDTRTGADGTTRVQSPVAGRFVVRLGNAVVAGEGSAPVAVTELQAPAPNPVAGRATLRYGLAEAGTVRVAVYDVQGRQVAVLADGEQGAGAHAVTLEAGALAAGVYVVRMTAGEFTAVRRLTVVR